MLRIAFVLTGACAAALSPPVWARPSESVEASRPAVPANAMRLSRLLNPQGKLVELSVRALEFGFTAQLERSPDDAALFKQFPGLDRAILDALRPILTRHVTAEIPAIDRRSAEFFAERFHRRNWTG